MMRRSSCAAVLAVFLLSACSGGNPRGLRVGKETDDHGNDGGSAGAGSGNPEGVDAAVGSEALNVHVKDIHEVTIEVITLACAGDCADVEAVASGGNPPYVFAWEDGSKNAKRRLCPDAMTKYTVSATDTAIESDEFHHDAQTVKAGVTANVLTCPGDAAVDAGELPPPTCEDGETVVSDVMGAITYFGGGSALPAGRYRVRYFDGCMKFGPPVNWTVNNFGVGNWFLVGETSATQLGALPGVTGFGYVAFDECVTLSRMTTPIEIDFAGGKLGVWLSDQPYTDNIAGEDGRNPTWCLTRL